MPKAFDSEPPGIVHDKDGRPYHKIWDPHKRAWTIWAQRINLDSGLRKWGEAKENLRPQPPSYHPKARLPERFVQMPSEDLQPLSPIGEKRRRGRPRKNPAA